MPVLDEDFMSKPLLISFSGGLTSGLMTAMLCDYFADREKAIVFANTGLEDEETLIFVNECDKRWNLGVVWVEALINPEFGKGTRHTIVDFASAHRKGEPFEAVIAKYGITNKAFPHCTRELKKYTIQSYIKNDLGWTDYQTAIGIRADERNREKDEYYPLIEWGIDLSVVQRFWANQSFTLNLKPYEGNCKFCWKKSDKKLVRLAMEQPEGLDWYKAMEKKYSTMQAPHRQKLLEPNYFFRGKKSAMDLLELAEIAKQQHSLFETLDETETDCYCKS